MFVQLNKCVVCGSVLQRGHSGDEYLTSSILFKYERSRGHLFVLSWASGTTGCSGGVLFRECMYCGWYGVFDLVVLSAVEVCADYGGVNVFHVCLNFGGRLWCWGLCQCLWCSLCCCMLFVSYTWVL